MRQNVTAYIVVQGPEQWIPHTMNRARLRLEEKQVEKETVGFTAESVIFFHLVP